MKCPVCTTIDLLITERQGIEIDYCPQCRGIWLDRGELDKIIERSSSTMPQQSSLFTEQRYRESDQRLYQKDHGHEHDHDSEHKYENSHKKKSFLKEFFDF